MESLSLLASILLYRDAGRAIFNNMNLYKGMVAKHLILSCLKKWLITLSNPKGHI